MEEREIKFRGWHLLEQKWVYGGYFKYADGRVIIIEDRGSCSDHHSEVDPATVGQYIGRKDSQGVEIYDGDCAIDPDRMEGRQQTQIMWGANCSAWMLFGERWSEYLNHVDEGVCERLTVNGNIHQNPELIVYEKKGK